MSLRKPAGRGEASARSHSIAPRVDPAQGENARGILAILAAMAFFVINDTFVKLASEELGTAQIIFIRGSFAIAMVLVLAFATGALKEWPRHGWGVMALRTVGEIGGTVLFLTALFHMPIANVTAILQAMPLLMTVWSALMLGEVVRWRRWLAVIAGFVGMILVVQPGTGAFDVYALIAVASLLFSSMRDLCSRFLPATIPTVFVALVSMVSVTVVGGAWAATEPWAPVSGRVLAYLVCAAVLLTGGFYFIIEAMRHGEMSVVAPFRYSIILWAIALGYLVWGQLPDMMAIAGIVLIVASGTYVFYRESRLHAAARRIGANSGLRR